MELSTELEINSHVQRICVFANNLTLTLRKKTKIKSDLIFYEEVFFFYFLDNSFYNINDYPVEITSNVGTYLFKFLAGIKRGDYETFEKSLRRICWDRFKTYCDILAKYDEKYTPDFFFEAFMYQSELLDYIKIKNTFQPIYTPPSSLQDWIKKCVENTSLQKTCNLLVKNSNKILDYFSTKK